MSLELKGTVKRIGDIETFPSGFQKRELVIVTEEQYPQPIAIEFLKDKGDLLNGLNDGDSITVGINIGGREWTSPQGDVRYFNSITGWKIEKGESGTHTAKPYNETPKLNDNGNGFITKDDDSGLPF